MQADVVGRREAVDVVEHVALRHAAHPLADDHRELALVVEEMRAGRAPHRAEVSVERARRLDEVGGLRRHPRDGVLEQPRAVGQVHGDDLRGRDRREPADVVGGELAAVVGDHAPALQVTPDAIAADLDPHPLHDVLPALATRALRVSGPPRDI